MAILSEHLRQTKTVTDANGDHIKLSRWTHADSVHLSNGLTLDESVVYLKQADWDALGDEKYTNNVEYRITDATSEVHGSVVGVKGDAESSYRDGEVNITAENIGLGNVPNVETNDQIVTYEVAESNTTLTSGEKLSVAFGKIAKAISSFITHLADKVSHITSDERAKWDGYETSISKLNGDVYEHKVYNYQGEYVNVTVSKVGNIKQFSCTSLPKKNIDANTTISLCTLPDEYKNLIGFGDITTINSSGTRAKIEISDGIVKFTPMSSMDTGSWVIFTFTYI